MQTISSDILNGEKKLTVMALRIDNGPVLQKRFEEYEKLYEQVKDLMPSSFLPPPKKKLLQSEVKLNEKRRQWVLALSQTLLQDSPSNSCVRTFFAGLSDEDDSHVDLGPSEVKTLGPKDFQFLKTVGKGSFGRVFVVKHRTDGKIYAMKVLQKDHIRKKNEVKHVMAERNVLKHNIHHPFLVSLHYSFQTKEKLYFVLDFLNGGELFSHLQREKSFSETRSRFYASQIASALGYLHENNIIYRDLKPENLLLDKHGYLVLTDFGLCKEGIKANDTTHTFCGTPEYLAPEILFKKSYDRTVDWWCLGSVLYEMLFGLPPFYSKDQTEMYDRIVNSPLKFKHHVSPGSTDLLTGLLQKDRTRRLGSRHDFTDIKNHPWFMPVDWEKLLRREVKAPFIPKIKDELDYSQFAKEFTDSNFNPASLAPQTYGAQVRDVDFGGFTYVEKHI